LRNRGRTYFFERIHDAARRVCRTNSEIGSVHGIEAGLRSREKDLRSDLFGLALDMDFAYHTDDGFPLRRPLFIGGVKARPFKIGIPRVSKLRGLATSKSASCIPGSEPGPSEVW